MANPKIKVKATRAEKILNFLSLLAIIGMFGYTILMLSQLPDTIPIHFNAFGKPDGWGSKTTIIYLPIVALLTFIGMFIVSKFPRFFNMPITITEENAPRVYPIVRQLAAMINFEITVLFAVLQLDIIQSANSGNSNISLIYLILFLVAPLVTCIFYYIKLSKIEK